jgi:hypothetical protein
MMARAKKQQAPKREQNGGARFEARPIVSVRPLVRVHSTGEAWTNVDAIALTLPAGMTAGSIVRLDPPADATDELVAAVREAFVVAGAAAVRVGERPKSVVVTPRGDEIRPAPRDVRQVVAELVAEANLADPARDDLGSLAEDIMSKAGI